MEELTYFRTQLCTALGLSEPLFEAPTSNPLAKDETVLAMARAACMDPEKAKCAGMLLNRYSMLIEAHKKYLHTKYITG